MLKELLKKFVPIIVHELLDYVKERFKKKKQVQPLTKKENAEI